MRSNTTLKYVDDVETVTLEFVVDGLPLNVGDDVFSADTGLTKDEWHQLSYEQREEVAHEVFNERVQYGWRVAESGEGI